MDELERALTEGFALESEETILLNRMWRARFIAHQKDVSQCLLALCNALEATGVVTKTQVAEAAQERLLARQPEERPAVFEALLLLKSMATHFELAPNDLMPPSA